MEFKTQALKCKDIKSARHKSRKINMPRLPRVSLENCLYYITLKGNYGENIFSDQEDYRVYLELLEKYKEQYKFKLFSFSLLPKQLSLLIELKGDSTISMIMQNISSSYTKYFNNRYTRKGHLFQQRFKSVVIEKDHYLLSMISYVHLEPVMTGLVNNPCDYLYTSYLLYLYHGQPRQTEQNIISILNLENEIEEVLNVIREHYPEKKDYAEYISAVTQKELGDFGKKLYRRGILGSEEFVERIESYVKTRISEIEEKKNQFPVIAVYMAVVLLTGVGLGVFYIQKNASIRQKQEAQPIKEEKPMFEPLRELDNTEWSIELRAQGNIADSYPEFDKLVFKEGKITSHYFSKRGFASSNYTLTLQDNKLIWETMQKNSQGQTLFWRGEVEEENMQGTVSLRDEKNIPQDFSFVSMGLRYRKKGNR